VSIKYFSQEKIQQGIQTTIEGIPKVPVYLVET
jgi:hypothetical protein